MAVSAIRTSLVCLLTSLTLYSAPINLVGNSSFEAPIVSPGANQINIYLNGSKWQVFQSVDVWGLGYPSYGVEFQKNNLYVNVASNGANGDNAYDGSQWAELDIPVTLSNGKAVPQIFQDISTVVGATYILTFYYTPRPDAGSQELGVFWGDTSAPLDTLLQPTVIGQGSSSLNWQQYTYTELVATSTSMRLGFGSLLNPVNPSFSGGNLIDLVSLVLDPNSVIGAPTTGTPTTGTPTTGTATTGTSTTGTPTTGTSTTGTSTTGTSTTGTPTGTPSGGDVPEPGSYLLVGSGVAALLLMRNRRG